MIEKLFNKLIKNKLTISAAESITGGKFSSLLTGVSGASNILQGSFICYSNEFKFNILDVSKNIDVISEQMAIELAQQTRIKANSNIAISFTGNASENGQENKPKGLSYISITNGDITEVTQFKSIETDRERIIEDTVIFGIQFILNFLEKNY